MKRILTAGFALILLAFAPVASFARDHDYRESQGYSNYDRGSYDRGNYGYGGYEQNTYPVTRDYNPGYYRNDDYDGYRYGYSDRRRWHRSAEYVGGGAAAGAVLGAIIGHAPGAAIGALIGGTGGYLYKKHKDHERYGYGY